jgi:hypothetical protein
MIDEVVWTTSQLERKTGKLIVLDRAISRLGIKVVAMLALYFFALMRTPECRDPVQNQGMN